LCPRHEDAEDAVQQIFVDVWRNAVKFDPEIASEATYITMIARRRLIDSYRRRRRNLDAACLAEEPPTADANHERRIEITDEAEHVHKYIEQLRPAERKVLEMSINDGMSQSQVARALNLPLGTVKTHARRGLIRLRELLEVDAVACTTGLGA
jgi:RNA polymerase sigma-70 factor (ECF subfamily)